MLGLVLAPSYTSTVFLLVLKIIVNPSLYSYMYVGVMSSIQLNLSGVIVNVIVGYTYYLCGMSNISGRHFERSCIVYRKKSRTNDRNQVHSVIEDDDDDASLHVDVTTTSTTVASTAISPIN